MTNPDRKIGRGFLLGSSRHFEHWGGFEGLASSLCSGDGRRRPSLNKCLGLFQFQEEDLWFRGIIGGGFWQWCFAGR
jgi:hypothetical protein